MNARFKDAPSRDAIEDIACITIRPTGENSVQRGTGNMAGWNDVMQQRHDFYQDVNYGCGNGKIYCSRPHRLIESRCKSFACGRCRPKKVSQLLKMTVRVGQSKKELRRHLVITVPGKEFRQKVSADESFDYMTKKFKSFKRAYKREFGRNLEYISFHRSQEDGYCHLHVLCGSYIDNKWMTKALARCGLGFGSIGYCDIHRLRNYLSKYWWKEHEWWIPENKQHFSKSRGINFDDYLTNSEVRFREISKTECFYHPASNQIYDPYMTDQVGNAVHDWEREMRLYGQKVLVQHGYPAPFEFLLGQFYEKLNQLEEKGRKATQAYWDNYFVELKNNGTNN